MVKVLICGGRNFDNYQLVKKTINKICYDRMWLLPNRYQNNSYDPYVEIISGMARGADSLGVRYAIENKLPLHEFHADWDKYGSKAGPIRNRQMLDEGKPDLVIAFPSRDSRGTYHMIDIARKAGVEVIVVG